MMDMKLSEAEFREKFIGYVDVLGFTNLVKSAEAGTGITLPALLELPKHLGTAESRERYVEHGPHICPQAPFIQRDLDFEVTQVSDCAVVSAEISPAGAINVVNHCWAAVLELLLSGIMCRGYITRGSIYDTGAQVIGSGYNRAFAMEKHGISAFRREGNERGTPFWKSISRSATTSKNAAMAASRKCSRGRWSRMAPSQPFSRSRGFRINS
jgi:hypothetical protein